VSPPGDINHDVEPSEFIDRLSYRFINRRSVRDVHHQCEMPARAIGQASLHFAGSV
jgi:hypothetical protein